MSMLQDTLNQVRSRVSQVRSKIQLGGMAGKMTGQSVGGGKVVQQAKQRANQLSRRMMERKPGILSMVKEFTPGERAKQIFSPQTGHRTTGSEDMSVVGRSPKPADGRGMSFVR